MNALSGILNFSKKSSTKEKIFCIGRNKTGTKSLSKALTQLGYKVADQRTAELLLNDWSRRDFSKIIKFCKKGGDVFQDVPFSLPYTYVVLDQNFPGSKFILTMRDNPEQWYNSLVGFHSEKFSPGTKPTKEDLMNAKYVEPGWMWKANRIIYNTPEDDPYNQSVMIDHYIKYNESVIEYFRNRKQDLLILNPSYPQAFQNLADFLGLKKNILKPFPWENKSGHFKNK
jgi:hypothetical protein